jgi:hypothetical protein
MARTVLWCASGSHDMVSAQDAHECLPGPFWKCLDEREFGYTPMR